MYMSIYLHTNAFFGVGGVVGVAVVTGAVVTVAVEVGTDLLASSFVSSATCPFFDCHETIEIQRC